MWELKEEEEEPPQLLMEAEEDDYEEEEDTSALLYTRERESMRKKMTTTMADLDLEMESSDSDSNAAASAAVEEEAAAAAQQSIFLDPTQASDHATGLGAENQVEKQDNVSAQQTNYSSSNGNLENGSHSNGVHEISSSSEIVTTIADGLKLITTIREGRQHILPSWSGSLDHVSGGSTSTSQVHEIEVEKEVSKGDVKVEEYDLEKILDEQETHDLYCPNCKSCITRRVILKKRKRTVRQETRKEPPKRPQLVEPPANAPSQTINQDSPEVFRCLSCFTFFIPTGCGFNIFRIFERRNVDQQVQPQHSSASVENCGSWLLSCFRTIDSPKPLNNADSLEEPLVSDSQRTDNITSVEENTPLHSDNTIGKAEQSNKPSPTGSQTTAATYEVKESFSQFHASSKVVTGSTQTEAGHVVTVQRNGARQEQIPLSRPAVDTKTDTSHLGHKEEFTQTEAGHVVTVQRNGARQEQIPLSQPSGDTANDSMHLGHKQDILEDIMAPSDNSTFFSPSFVKPVLTIPIKVLPGEDNQTVEKPTPVIRQPAEPEAPPHRVLAVPEAEALVPAPSAERDEWDILKAVVYGGLVESITSLSVVSAAAASGAKTLDIFILGIANLIGGLPVLYHNIADLRNTGDIAESSEQVGHYWLELGRRSKYQLHMVIAILSYILFGLLPPVIYGLSFRTSDNRENKVLVVAAASLLCIALLAIGKAHVKRHRTYLTTLLYYLSIGFSSSGLSYVAGVLLTKVLAHFGIIDQGGASAPAPPGLSFPEAAAWASY